MLSSSQILLYSGEGVGLMALEAFEKKLKEICDERFYTIKKVNSLGNACWTDPKSVNTLVIPGGNAATMWYGGDFPEVSKQLPEILKKYKVSYLGICAGGIVASSQFHDRYPLTSRQKEGIFSSQGHTFLKLYPGKVIAPLAPKPPSTHLSYKDFNITNVKFNSGETVPVSTILNPGYLHPEEIKNNEVIATYEELPPMAFINDKNQQTAIQPNEIAESIFYQGIDQAPVLLTGSHLEINSAEIRSGSFKEVFHLTTEQQNLLGDTMEPSDAARMQLLKQNFEKLNIKCK